jgi:hypothetical protein
LANHNVRVVWAMLLNGEAYHANPAEAAMTR